MYLIFFEIIFVNRKQKLSYLCIIVIHLATKIRDIKLVKFLMAIKHNNKMNFFLHQSSFSKLSSRETNFEAFLHNSSEKLRRFRFMFTLSQMKAQMLTLFCIMISMLDERTSGVAPFIYECDKERHTECAFVQPVHQRHRNANQCKHSA